MVVCNATLAEAHWKTDPIAGPLTFHQLGWIICLGCTLISTGVSLYLIYKHATNYTNRNEQRQIIRILFMVPIYSITTMFSYVWYWHAVYWQVARDCYEAFAIAAFFSLMCYFIAPDLHQQKEYFVAAVVDPWPWPISWINKCANGKLRQPRNGLTWFNIIWVCIFQYCFIRVSTTIIATVTQVYDRYCGSSSNPAFAHFWTMFFNCIAVAVAMYMLIAFYLNVKTVLAPHKPLLKLLCIKLVIFFSFWQMVVLDLLATQKIIKPSKKISHGDILVGFNALLVCFEMILFSILHLYAFSVEPYRASELGTAIYAQPPKSRAWKALLDTFNPFDIVKGFLRGLKWSVFGRRQRHEEAEKMGRRDNSPDTGSTHGLVTPTQPPFPMPGAYSGLGVYAPVGNGSGGLVVHHPTPNDQEHVATEEIPTHGYATREHEAPYTAAPPGLPTSPTRGAPAGPGLSTRRPSAPTALPYPATNTMPSLHRQQPYPVPYAPPNPGESHELLRSNPPAVQDWQGPGLRGGGRGYTYSESMVDEEGVYQGPNPRRGTDDEPLRYKVV